MGATSAAVRGAVECAQCEKGQFSNATGASECRACGAGEYADTTGATACTACPAGRYSNPVIFRRGHDAGHFPAGPFCQDNQAWTDIDGDDCHDYADYFRQTCDPDTAASYARNGVDGIQACCATYETVCSNPDATSMGGLIGPTRCTQCSTGKFSSSNSASSCMDCAAGRVSGEGATECVFPEKQLDDTSPEKMFLAFGIVPLVLCCAVFLVFWPYGPKPPRDAMGLAADSRCWSVFKIASGSLDFASDLVFVMLLDSREPVRFGIGVASCVLSTCLSLGIAWFFDENFFLLLTTSLDCKETYNHTALAVNRCIVLFVEDVTFLGLEISLLLLGKKLNGLDWVIWAQALAFTLINIMRNVCSFCQERQTHSIAEDGIQMGSLGSQALS